MDKLLINGGNKIEGTIVVSGAKNVAMKVLLTGLLTSHPINVSNVPKISSVKGTADLISHIGVKVTFNNNHTISIVGNGIKSHEIPLEMGGLYRTATMVIGPLLQRFGKAVVPNPGGCRLGLRPIDWHIEGLKKMGAKIKYEEGFFHASCDKLIGCVFQFPKNSHTGTETLLLAAVKAQGETVLKNASEEPEVDDLIKLLNQMGAKIKRLKNRSIIIHGVKNLKGTDFAVMPDRNEAVTFAILALASSGKVIVKGAQAQVLRSFLNCLDKVNAKYKIIDSQNILFSNSSKITSSHITTAPFPGFMTDWQAPWSLLMTQANGHSTVHETIFESRFSYVSELLKMGAKISRYQPQVKNPKNFYNFTYNQKLIFQGIRISGPTLLHEAVLNVSDLRAGATLILAAAISEGKSILYGIDHIDRGYENIEGRLHGLGIPIQRLKE